MLELVRKEKDENRGEAEEEYFDDEDDTARRMPS